MDNRCNEIIKRCIDRWTYCDDKDERVVHFKNEFEKWFDCFNPKEQDIVEKLLDNFIYYDKQNFNRLLVELHQKLMQSNNYISIENTVYAFIISGDAESNSSNDYWYEYKKLNFKGVKGEKKYFTPSIEQYFTSTKDRKNIKNIVFIDDFCGTGTSLSRFLKKIVNIFESKNIANIFESKNIYFVTIHAMSQGIEHLKNKNIEVICCNKQDKAFSNGYFETNADESKNIIIEKSVNLGIQKKYILGYKDTQSLVAFFENTPNNTLGIFCCPTENFSVIFPREEHVENLERKLEKIQGNKKERGIKKLNSATRSENE